MAKVTPASSVIAAHFAEWPSFAKRRITSGRRAQGMRYERKAQAHLLTLDELYVDGPWLRFLDESGWRWCQPDGILIDFCSGVLTIVEIKYQHTPDAWRQMEDLYAPVLRFLFPEHLWKFRFLEVVKWYDPDVKCSANPRLVAEPFHQHYDKGLHIWRP